MFVVSYAMAGCNGVVVAKSRGRRASSESPFYSVVAVRASRTKFVIRSRRVNRAGHSMHSIVEVVMPSLLNL